MPGHGEHGIRHGRATPAASPWAAVWDAAFDEVLYQAILDQPDAGAAGWALLTGATAARSAACDRLLTLGLLQPPDSMGGLGAVDPGWRSAR